MAIRLPNGDPVWKRPANTNYMLPFHTSTATTSATCAKAPSMSYLTDIAMWNKGLCNAWNTARQPGLGMSYFSRDDLRYDYALADAFTICDQYYASTFTQTNPNRLHLFSGSSGLSVGFDPALDNAEPTQGFKWQTVAEMLEAAGVRRVDQQPDNFGDNALALFHHFKTAAPASALYRKGMATVDNIAEAFCCVMLSRRRVHSSAATDLKSVSISALVATYYLDGRRDSTSKVRLAYTAISTLGGMKQ